MAQLKDLLVSGSARIIGKVYSPEFVGKLTGNADTATKADKADKDGDGQTITGTYLSNATINGRTLTLTAPKGKTITLTTQDTNTWRGIQNNVTSDSTTDSLSAAQGKYLKSLIDGKSNNGHNHDDRYYTETEIDNKLKTYVPLAGGVMTGILNFQSTSTNRIQPNQQDIIINGIAESTTVGSAPGIGFHIGNKNWGSLKFLSDGSFRFYNASANGYNPVYASNFYGALKGNADTATNATSAGKASNDSSGNSIVGTYFSSVKVDANDSHKYNFLSPNGATKGSITIYDEFQKRSTVTATTDWNTLIKTGIYKVQMSAWGDATKMHSPNSYNAQLYNYGILLVFESVANDSEKRFTQIYIPHNEGVNVSGSAYKRMHNGSDTTTGWQVWHPIARGLSWNELTGKPNYAGSGSAGGAATSANKLNTDAGSNVQPIYFKNGVPVTTSYSLNATVNGAGAGCASRLTYYSGDNTISSTANFIYKDNKIYFGNNNTAGGYLNGNATNGGCNSILIGDDVWLGDANVGGMLGLKSNSGNNSGLIFLNNAGTEIGRFYAQYTDANIINLFINKSLYPTDSDKYSLGDNNHYFSSVTSKWLYANVKQSGTEGGVSLFGCDENYSICFRQTSNLGTHGFVNGDWATYFVMSNTAHRGWIFRTYGNKNVASIDTDGNTKIDGLLINSLGPTCGGNGKYSYYKIMTITITGSYINRPISFEVSGRGRYNSKVTILFNNTDSKDPGLYGFITDLDNAYFIKKTATSTWEVYGQYSETWGTALIHRITGEGYGYSGINITLNMTNIDSLPSGTTRASYAYNASYANSAAKLTTARTITLSGAVTGSVSFDGSQNVTLATAVNHTHNYAGSSSAGGSANSAVKLDTASAGSSTQPVYFSGGKPVACGTSLDVSITGNAATATNADKLDGYHGSSSQTANTYVLRNSNGYIYTNYINSNTGNGENPTISQIIVTNGSDGFYRKATLAHLKTSLGSMPASDVYSWAKASTKPSYSWDEITGKPSTFTPSSHSHNYITSNGRNNNLVIASANAGTSGASGLAPIAGVAMYEYYASSTGPTNYGNLLTVRGSASPGATQIALPWSGTDNIAPYIRAHSDWGNTHTWSNWKQLCFTDGSGASGSWGISVTGSSASCTGNAATATKFATARTITLSGAVTGSVSFDGSANATINTSVNHSHSQYLPLAGGTMTGNINFNTKGTNYIGNGANDNAYMVGGAFNNLVISSWYGVSFTTSCNNTTFTNKNAVSIDCRNGILAAASLRVGNGSGATINFCTSSGTAAPGAKIVAYSDRIEFVFA